MTFSLHAVTFLHVLHLDILRRQIEIETESKNKNFLMYGYNAGPPMAIPIYTVLPYCVIRLLEPLQYLQRTHCVRHRNSSFKDVLLPFVLLPTKAQKFFLLPSMSIFNLNGKLLPNYSLHFSMQSTVLVPQIPSPSYTLVDSN